MRRRSGVELTPADATRCRSRRMRVIRALCQLGPCLRHRPGLLRRALLALSLCTGAGSAGAEAQWVGSYVWTMDDPRFGGFSAIDLRPGGRDFLALTDRGYLVRGQLLRDDKDRVIAIEATAPTPLRGLGGGVLAHGYRDSEGIALTADGGLFVSFEDPARVLHYPDPGGPAIALPLHPDFRRLPVNRQLEALAVDDRGTLYTIPEDPPQGEAHYPVYRYRETRWDIAFHLRRDALFRPTAADIGPDGHLYVLERAVSLLQGFRSRIRRLDPGATGLQAGEIMLLTPPLTHGNLEGLSVWRDATGAIRATMIADNNFKPFLTTEIVEYRLAD